MKINFAHLRHLTNIACGDSKPPDFYSTLGALYEKRTAALRKREIENIVFNLQLDCEIAAREGEDHVEVMRLTSADFVIPQRVLALAKDYNASIDWLVDLPKKVVEELRNRGLAPSLVYVPKDIGTIQPSYWAIVIRW